MTEENNVFDMDNNNLLLWLIGTVVMLGVQYVAVLLVKKYEEDL